MELDVPAEAAGERLDTFLAATLGSRSHVQRMIVAGSVRVDGETVRKNHRVRGGEERVETLAGRLSRDVEFHPRDP